MTMTTHKKSMHRYMHTITVVEANKKKNDVRTTHSERKKTELNLNVKSVSH